jgi:spore coat protein U-like protein
VFRQLTALLLFVFASAAHAIPNCSVSSADANFGVYDNTAGAPLDSTSGSITVTCSDNALSAPRSMYYEIKLGAGGSGNYAPRVMPNGGFNLNYYLYRSASYNAGNVWGDATSGSSFTLAACITVPAGGSPSSPSVHLVHGRIPAAQTPVAVGRYADTLSVSVVLYGDCASGTAAPTTLISSPVLAVQADVLAKCIIATGPYNMDFGDYTRGGGAKTADAKIGVTCPANTSYSIALSGLEGGNRYLVRGANRLEYNLYANAGRTSIIGETERVDTIDGIGTGLRVDTTIYGLLPDSTANQTVPPGLYQAVVTITVSY